MILPILAYPDPILKKKTEKIEDAKSPETRELILNMLETLKEIGGLGLAAPQVGKSVSLCVIRLNQKTYILINPQVKSKSFRKEVLEEGCLSFPGQYYPVKRHKKVGIVALDRKGNKIKIQAEGILSRALQHEIDHLDGILFIDRLDKKTRKLLAKNKK